jgi:hypothetical protein
MSQWALDSVTTTELTVTKIEMVLMMRKLLSYSIPHAKLIHINQSGYKALKSLQVLVNFPLPEGCISILLSPHSLSRVPNRN